MTDLRLSKLEVEVLDKLIANYGPLLYDHRGHVAVVQSDEVYPEKTLEDGGIKFKILLKKNLKL